MAIKISNEDIRSGKFIPSTVSSDPYIYLMLSKPYIVQIGGEKFAVDKTSYRIYAQPLSEYMKYGSITQIDDIDFESWNAGSGAPIKHEYVRLPEKTSTSGIAESFGERMMVADSRDTPVRLFVHDVYAAGIKNNEIGKYFSKLKNLELALLDYYRTEGAQALASYLESKGLPSEDIGYLAVGLLPEGAIYGVTRTKDGKILLAAAEDVNKIEYEQARVFGISNKDVRYYAFDEEHVHIRRRSPDLVRKGKNIIDEESTTKNIVRDFYLSKEKGSEGNPKLVRKYRKLAEIKQDDISTTPKRYSKIQSPYQKFYSKEIGEVVDENDSEQKISGLEQIVENQSEDVPNQTIYSEKSARPVMKLIKGGKYEQNESKERYKKPDPSEYQSMSDAKAAREVRKEKSDKTRKEELEDANEGKSGGSLESTESSMAEAA